MGFHEAGGHGRAGRRNDPPISKVIHRRRAARQDLLDIFRYHAREAGLRVAERFFAQAEATFNRLASMPGMGTHFDHDHPVLAELRFFPVSRFPKSIVSYRPVADGIQIVRVLHGARDIQGILAEEFGITEDTRDDAAGTEAGLTTTARSRRTHRRGPR